MAHATERNLQQLQTVARRFGWLYRLRPQSFVEPLYRLIRPHGGRAIIQINGVRMYVDPFTTHGMELVVNGSYEDELAELTRAELPVGGTFLDIGANEGLISAIAARAVGPEGLVVAVEPQTRLRDYLEINLSLNASCPYRILETAITAEDGEHVKLNLGPSSHSGGSSLVRPYRWRLGTQTVIGRSIDGILHEFNDMKADLVKVDVEGYEPEVIASAQRSLARKRIGCLAVDFHNSILTRRGKKAADVEAQILSHGYRRYRGSPEHGYTVYAV